jgi:integrase
MRKPSLRITVKVGQHQQERRFPVGTSLRAIQDWKDRVRGRLKEQRPKADKGTLTTDVDRYLETLADRPALKKERTYQLEWWLRKFGRLRRSEIDAAMLRSALAELRTTKAASTCNHYRIALSHLWTTLDGRNAQNPLRDVPMFQEPESEPRNLPGELVRELLAAFPAIGRTVKGQKRARVNLGHIRLTVMLTTGLSPAEIMRVGPGDLMLASRAVYVRRRQKGKGSEGMMLPLTSAGIEALERFAAANAFGAFSTHALYQSWVRACKRLLKRQDLTEEQRRVLQTARPYDLRHTFGTFVLQQTQNLKTTQELLRHRSSKTTKRYVRAAVADHLRAAVDGLAVAGQR